MRIVVVSLYPKKAEKHVNMSGVTSYTKNLLRHIPVRPSDELFVVCNKINGQAEEYKDDGITVVRAFDRNYKFVRQIYQQIDRLEPDVVHIQQEIPLYGGLHTAFMLPGLLWLLRHYTTVITLHHVVSLKKINKAFVASNKSAVPVWAVRGAFKFINTLLVRLADTTITHEQYFKDVLVGEYGCNGDTITVVPHGVENFSAQPSDVARKKIGATTKQHIVLFMGYLAGYKGLDLLLEGFAEYAKTDPNALLLIGAGKHNKFAADSGYLRHYEATRQKARSLIPAAQYKWLGFIAENSISDYYSASDVSAFPYTISISSSGPMAFAMGYEKPFLASYAFADVLPKELLFDRTPAALAKKLRYFFAHTAEFAAFSAQFKTQRLWQKVSATTKELYERLNDDSDKK